MPVRTRHIGHASSLDQSSVWKQDMNCKTKSYFRLLSHSFPTTIYRNTLPRDDDKSGSNNNSKVKADHKRTKVIRRVTIEFRHFRYANLLFFHETLLRSNPFWDYIGRVHWFLSPTRSLMDNAWAELSKVVFDAQKYIWRFWRVCSNLFFACPDCSCLALSSL